jgi:hypothetical protein
MKMIMLQYFISMTQLLSKLDWWFDYYFAWMFYNGMQQERYVEYMRNKWPEKIKDFENSK